MLGPAIKGACLGIPIPHVLLHFPKSAKQKQKQKPQLPIFSSTCSSLSGFSVPPTLPFFPNKPYPSLLILFFYLLCLLPPSSLLYNPWPLSTIIFPNFTHSLTLLNPTHPSIKHDQVQV